MAREKRFSLLGAHVDENLANGAAFDSVVSVGGAFEREANHGQSGGRSDRERAVGHGAETAAMASSLAGVGTV